MRSRTCAGVGPPAPREGRSSGGGVVRGGSTVTAGGVAAAGAVAVEAGDEGVTEGGRAAGATDGLSGTTGSATTTAGTGSIATRGGGSGISSGTFADDRAGLDAQEAISSAKPATTPCLMRISYSANLLIFQFMLAERQEQP